MDLLARREHSRDELAQKLAARGFGVDLVEAVIDELAAENLQSDDRYHRGLYQRAHRQGLLARCVSGRYCVAAALMIISSISTSIRMIPNGRAWPPRSSRRFGIIEPGDRRTYAKAVRFLQQRGFSGEQISRALQGLDARD
ncbi:MAG: regulatory protein RecX [Gammaproteobacteria bacterium]|nr:regulatory protein RecX [Gammaproteobacteria bacterium]